MEKAGTNNYASMCGSFECGKYSECARTDVGQTKGAVRSLVMWGSYGSGSMDSGGKAEITHACGEMGDYKMFRPKVKGCNPEAGNDGEVDEKLGA